MRTSAILCPSGRSRNCRIASARMIEGAVKSRRRSRRSPTLRRETWRIARKLRLPIRGSKAPALGGGQVAASSTSQVHAVRGAPSRHHQTAHCRRGSRVGALGRFTAHRVSCLCARPDRLLRWGTTRTYAARGFGSGGDMAGVAAIADPRRMSSSRATRTASRPRRAARPGLWAFLGRFSMCFHGLSHPRSAAASVEARQPRSTTIRP
jgi:hypothetical protein